MCRLLGVVAGRPAPLSELLADELDAFVEQACEHGDGWGISYWPQPADRRRRLPDRQVLEIGRDLTLTVHDECAGQPGN